MPESLPYGCLAEFESPEALIEAYLSGTPFVELLTTAVQFVLPEQARFEHHWIVGGSGHGKTNAILNLILDDLQRVADGEASIVVIDSQNTIIPAICSTRPIVPAVIAPRRPRS